MRCTAVTDVTGFGLAEHLLEMTNAGARLAATLRLDDLPPDHPDAFSAVLTRWRGHWRVDAQLGELWFQYICRRGARMATQADHRPADVWRAPDRVRARKTVAEVQRMIREVQGEEGAVIGKMEAGEAKLSLI